MNKAPNIASAKIVVDNERYRIEDLTILDSKRAGYDIHVVNDTVAKHEPRVGDWWIDENGMQTKLVNAGDIRDNPNDVRGMQ